MIIDKIKRSAIVSLTMALFMMAAVFGACKEEKDDAMMSFVAGYAGGAAAIKPTLSDTTVVAVQKVEFTNGQEASVVIGQSDFVSNLVNQGGSVDGNTFYKSYANSFVYSGKLYLGDLNNHRVLVYNSIPIANNAAASYAIGQSDLTTGVSGTSETVMTNPANSVIHNDKLLTVEYGNSRVAIYNTVPTAGPGTIDVVIGQADKTSNVTGCSRTTLNNPVAVAMAGDKVVVADRENSRVLIWNTIPTTDGQPADLVLGQADFTSCLLNRDGLTTSANSNTIYGATGVWSDGTKLVVADGGNNRVLIWKTFPTVSGQAADLVLGQVDFTSYCKNWGTPTGIPLVCPTDIPTPTARTLSTPYGVFFHDHHLVVADRYNHRVLIWNGFPSVNGSLQTESSVSPILHAKLLRLHRMVCMNQQEYFCMANSCLFRILQTIGF